MRAYILIVFDRSELSWWPPSTSVISESSSFNRTPVAEDGRFDPEESMLEAV